jgi:DNA-directed RNA polymerase subunit RPC12/RpoP
MAKELPKSMNECVYFTNRSLENNGKVKAWARKLECPECHKGLMGKPVDPKTKKPKIRATEYECQECGHTESKSEHEAKLIVEANYTCPTCGKEGEGEAPYKRKKWKGVDAHIITCEHCSEKIAVTKKMKAPKAPKVKA